MLTGLTIRTAHTTPGLRSCSSGTTQSGALGVNRLLASCLNCRHTALIDVSSYSAEIEVPSFRPRVKCGQCGSKNIDVRPNWKEQPPRESSTGKVWR